MVLSAVVAWLRDTASGPQTRPMIGISSRLRLRDRSGLIGVQLSPRSSLRYTLLLAQYKRRGECGLMMYGASQLVRSPPPRPPRPSWNPPALPASPAPPARASPAPPALPASAALPVSPLPADSSPSSG